MANLTNTDKEFMQKAIALGAQARLSAPPNPWVGCVIVKNKQIIGEGFSCPAGGAHAEVNALQKAGTAAQGSTEGSTVYVTLEPCNHTGKTPPCVDALIQAKVSRVVVALEDPDPRVNGKGIERLRKNGISVDIGICAEEAYASLKPYMHQRRLGRPYCVVKAAISIDGRIAASDGSSQWITTPEALRHSHQLRFESQAIMIGSGTAIADEPRLTARHGAHEGLKLKQPLRVLLDSRGRIKAEGPLFDISLAQTVIFTSENASEAIIKEWKSSGAEVEKLVLAKTGTGTHTGTGTGTGLDLHEVMRILAERGIIQVLVEGGSTLLGSLMQEKLIDEIQLYIGPRILGSDGRPLFTGNSPYSLKDDPELALQSVTQLGDSLCARYFTVNSRQ